MPEQPRLSAEDLTAVRQSSNWRHLFTALRIEKDSKKSREHDWWGKSPFKPEERTASFHINDQGWYCHATSQGGGSIELVQRLQNLNCYEAGRWLVEQGISSFVAATRDDVAALAGSSRDDADLENQPIRQDLCKQLDPEHPTCVDRSIPPEVFRELGAGYLDRPPRKNGRRDPLNQRIVFQIRGLKEDRCGKLRPVILSHTGRATTTEQIEQDGKWWTYAGFRKSLELYNLDHAILGDPAFEQAKETGHILVVEGPFDVAKLYAAGIRNVVATFGAHLSEHQLHRLDLIDELIGVNCFRFFYDRDEAGESGAAKAAQLIRSSGLGLEVENFDWNHVWRSPNRGEVVVPKSITDPGEFSVQQLRGLRTEGLI